MSTSTHGSHTNHTNHSNSLSNSGVNTKSHSVSYGTTGITEDMIPDNLEGTLSILAKAAKKARESLEIPNSESQIREVAFASEVKTLLDNSGGQMKSRYQNGTLNWEVSGNGGSFSQHSSNDEFHSPVVRSVHSSTGGDGHANTHGNTSGWNTPTNNDIKNFPVSYPNYQADDTMLKSHATNILSIINRGVVKSSKVASFGTWTISGSNHCSHSDHSSHSN